MTKRASNTKKILKVVGFFISSLIKMTEKNIPRSLMVGITILLMLIPVALAFTSLSVTQVRAHQVEVKVKVPEYVEEGKTFNVTIDVSRVEDLNSGMFDLSFDPCIVKVKEVTSGNISDIEIPITKWDFMDSGTIKVMFELPEDTTVSGSGYLAMITFEARGKQGDKSELRINNGELIKFVFSEFRAEPEEILANWHDAEIRVGIEEESEPTPAETPTSIPIPTATPKPAGFEAIFVAVTFAVVYILRRRREKR